MNERTVEYPRRQFLEVGEVVLHGGRQLVVAYRNATRAVVVALQRETRTIKPLCGEPVTIQATATAESICPDAPLPRVGKMNPKEVSIALGRKLAKLYRLPEVSETERDVAKAEATAAALKAKGWKQPDFAKALKAELHKGGEGKCAMIDRLYREGAEPAQILKTVLAAFPEADPQKTEATIKARKSRALKGV